MVFESELPIWQKLGTKPPDNILNTEGWGAGKKPPADWFDWLFNRNYLALKELQEKSYALPSSGIPKTDLATAVQTSLSKADSALQTVEAASTTTAGIVKIEDSVTSTSVTTAAAPKSVKAVKDDLDSYKADYVSNPKYVASTGTANTYVINPSPAISAYGEGQGFVVKINVDNTGASTINVNSKGAKPIVNAKGNPLPAGTLKANSVYSMRYNGTSFILQGEGASGNAVASDLLSGKTAGSDAGDLVGTMPNNGAVSITPGSTNKPIPLGYHNGNGVISGDNNLISSNILAGKTIFGIPGNVIAGKRYATGTSVSNSYRVIQVRGLSFRPRIILVAFYYENAGGTHYSYMHDFETYGNFIGMEATVVDTNGNFNGYGPILKSSGNLGNSFSNDGFDLYIGTSTTGVRWYAWE